MRNFPFLFMHRLSQFHICTIVCAANKRRGQTKVFPLLLIPLLFLAAVRRFLSESDTDMPLLLGYNEVDVSAFTGCCKFILCKRFHVPH